MSGQETELLVPSTAERGATIHFNDTFSSELKPFGAPPIYDFDSELTQVRNDGDFKGDTKFPIGEWPATGEYAAVLLTELREEQRRIYGRFEAFGREDLPDAQAFRRSLDRMVVGVINLAVRTEEQEEGPATDLNGPDFFIAELDGNIQIVSQLDFLRSVAGRGVVRGLWRINDDNPVWPKGEQYRSSIASQLRNFPEGLTRESLARLPVDRRAALTLGFGDKYGNGRLEVPEGVKVPDIMPGGVYQLRVDGKEVGEQVFGAQKLPGIPQDSLGVYTNPADGRHNRGVRYLELARLVGDPNDPSNSAYETLRRTVLPASNQHPDWSQIEIELAA